MLIEWLLWHLHRSHISLHIVKYRLILLLENEPLTLIALILSHVALVTRVSEGVVEVLAPVAGPVSRSVDGIHSFGHLGCVRESLGIVWWFISL